MRSPSRLRGAGGLVAVVFALILVGLFTGGFFERVSLFVADLAENGLLRAGVTLQEVRIKGQLSLSDAQIIKALGIRTGQSLAGFDAHQAQRKLSALGQVKTARVMRLLPSTVLVEITERRPFARWLHDGQIDLVDKSGVILSKSSRIEKSAFPLIAGEGAAEQAAQLIRLLSVHEALAKRIKMAEWVEHYRWNLHARNGAVIQLPPANLALSLARLISLPDWQAMLERPRLVVDMRSAQQAFVRERRVSSSRLVPRI
ncbi:MAG: FtsQ-type POTRA domain-containing protein [Hyphomicrobiaceae bacterium]|nr:FtsQ-type POTRA domain-containing protein [Hyphomicrobiaceae bacterium]